MSKNPPRLVVRASGSGGHARRPIATIDRESIRRKAGLVVLAVLGFLWWYFEWYKNAPVVFS